MSNFPNKSRPGQNDTAKLRKNERIKAPQVRVIGPDGKQVGVLPTNQACELAKKYGLDLVEVSPATRPPVCRILDFGKYMYEQSKKSKDSKSTSSKMKEIKFRVRIDQHDYMTKIKHGEQFLAKGNKLKLTLTFRGRELDYKDLGFETINRAIDDLKHIGNLDVEPRLAGKNISITMSPVAAAKRKLKYTVEDEEIEEDPNQDDEEE